MLRDACERDADIDDDDDQAPDIVGLLCNPPNMPNSKLYSKFQRLIEFINLFNYYFN